MAIDTSDLKQKTSSGVRFNKVGDGVKGILVGKEEFDGKFGKVTSYKFKAIEGAFHEDEASSSPVVCEPGSVYSVLPRTTTKDDLESLMIGQVAAVVYLEDKVSKKNGKPYKNVQVLKGALDEAYLASDEHKARLNAPPEDPNPSVSAGVPF